MANTAKKIETAKHTPCPWDTNGIHIYAPASKHVSEIDTVAGAHGIHGDDGTIQKANAEFICRAVNSHDELLGALKGLLSDTQNGEIASIGQVKQARAAIAKAEGGNHVD